jgi:hypothetical protein
MDEPIRNPVVTTRHDSPAISAEPTGEVFTRRVITVVLAAISALTFAFGFDNVWALGLSLGVPPFVAPLVGPAVDLSVAGLLIGIRHLSMAGVPRDQLRPARILLAVCGAATLALNIAGPVTAGAYGRAAFDSVGPGLLIGWAETGPGMPRFLYACPRNSDALHDSEERFAPAGEELPGGPGPVLNRPGSGAEADGLSRPGVRQGGRAGAVGLDELVAEARRIDQLHRQQHHRPVSADTLRKQMRIGSMRARTGAAGPRFTPSRCTRHRSPRPRPATPAAGAGLDQGTCGRDLMTNGSRCVSGFTGDRGYSASRCHFTGSWSPGQSSWIR